MRHFFEDFMAAINGAASLALTLFYPREWEIAKKIASN